MARAVLDNELGTKGKLEVVVDVKNKKAADQVKKISDEAKKVKDNMALANGELGKTAAEVKKQITALKALRDNTEKFDRATGKLNTKWQEFNNKLQIAKNQYGKLNFEGPINTLKNALTGVIGKFTLVQTLANLFTAAIQAIGRAIGDVVQNAIQMEVLSLQLEAFTGSASNAQRAFQAFGATAAATPFDLKQVAQAGKTMMAFGMSTKDSMEMTDRLAIAAAATGGELNNLARNLGQIQAQGRAYTRDLTQFAMQGIPIWEELSVVTGESVDALKSMAADGAIGFDEVSEAIRNMTDEGSAFAEIAKRMGDTVQGKLARIEQASDKVALSFAKAFNIIDKQVPVVSGFLKGLEAVLNFLAKNMENILLLLGSVALAIAAAFGVKALFMLKAFIASQGSLLLMLKAVNVALGVMKVLLTGFGPAMIAIAAVVAIFGALKAATNNAKKAAQEKAEADFVAMDAAKRLTDVELKKVAAHNTAIGVAANYVLAMREIAAASAEATEKEITKLEEIMAKRTEAHEKAMEDLDEEIEAKEQQIEDEKSEFKELMDLKKQAHEDRMDEIDEEYESRKKIIDDEIDRLREKGPYEQALYNLRKKELQDKIASNKLDGKALLQAQARLERMERNEAIQRERNKLDNLNLETQQKKTAEEQKYNTEVQNSQQYHDKRIEAMETELQTLKDKKTRAEELHDREQEKVRETIDSYRGQKKAVDDSSDALRTQIGVVKDLTAQTRLLEQQAIRAAAAMQKVANKEASSSSGSSRGEGQAAFRASGGPVTGGSTYTVNELGKEAFLSAQGRLSMINAPSWGSWTAPGKGTVIPAHLTSQLNIPTGGINLNNAASGNAMMASANQGAGSIVRAIKSAMMGGDNITNNVTVQSDNTTKTASDMLVSMTRLRRRRYS